MLFEEKIMSLTNRNQIPSDINPAVKNAKQQTMLDILGIEINSLNTKQILKYEEFL
jgi:hypothetical protein